MDTQSLQQIFQNRVFRIPDYQRGYAWEKEHVQDFLDDLDMLSENKHHYTGTIVLHKTGGTVQDSEGTTYARADIVDGQQRLTTTVLLLNELSRALAAYKEGDSLSKGTKKLYVVTEGEDGLGLHKLTPNSETDAFFKAVVLPEIPGLLAPGVGAALRMKDAKEQIAAHLSPVEGEANHLERLRSLHRKLTSRLYFNLYEVEDAAEVGVIFEVMNDRGKPLTNMEKVKNYLLYAATKLDIADESRDTLSRTINNTWATILRELTLAELQEPRFEDQLLRAHWLMQHDYRPTWWEGSKSIRHRFDLRNYRNRHDVLLQELTEYVNQLHNAVFSFCDALKPTRGGAFSSQSGLAATRAIQWNERFTRIGVTATFLPLLMAVRQRWPSDLQKYADMVELCEKYAFRTYRIASFRANTGESSMYRFAFDLANGHMEFEEAIRNVKLNMARFEGREKFDATLADDARRQWYPWNGLKYFLYEYESHLASQKGGSPKITWDVVSEHNLQDTIEHVLPQHIDDKPTWLNNFPGDQHGRYIHDIGNLALTRHNTQYSNKPFTEKKGTADSPSRCYATAPFYQEQELALLDDWTKDAIDERRKRLFAWARERWGVDFSDIDGTGPVAQVVVDEDEQDALDNAIDGDELNRDDSDE